MVRAVLGHRACVWGGAAGAGGRNIRGEGLGRNWRIGDSGTILGALSF